MEQAERAPVAALFEALTRRLEELPRLARGTTDSPAKVHELKKSGADELPRLTRRLIGSQLFHATPVAMRLTKVATHGPTRGARVPARGVERRSGLLPMVRKHGGLFVEP